MLKKKNKNKNIDWNEWSSKQTFPKVFWNYRFHKHSQVFVRLLERENDPKVIIISECKLQCILLSPS